LPGLRARIEPLGGTAVVLPTPVGAEPPTLLAPRAHSVPFRPLVDTYGTVRYADLDPTPFAAIAFALMFGMMFGDAGRGLMLVGLGLWARTGRGFVGRFRAGWGLAVAAGLTAIGFGIAFGEVFGPTHLTPALWLSPLDDPLQLLVAGLVLGAALLAASQVIGTINRWREGGPRFALYEPTGVAGLCSYAGLALLVAGLYEGLAAVAIAGGVFVTVGIVLVFSGRFVAAGGRATGFAQATVESLDGVVRLGSNVASFARLAAFGLTAAAIGSVVWDGTTALWHSGLLAVAAIALFVVGNLAAFALEALVVGVQALRLEYYELFSRIFGEEGRPFRPWHVALVERAGSDVDVLEEASCTSG
jgi:V/A-type H+-transporting ATPase subunit I